MKLLVTGSAGLIGSEVCTFFALRDWDIHGVDNNQRAVFFGPDADTLWNRNRLERELPSYTHHDVDIRDREGMLALLRDVQPDAIVHAAAQPSHDWAAREPFSDFDVNAVGTINVLEATRLAVPEAAFVYLSTNKVYGDGPNDIKVDELETRWDIADPEYANGIPETFRVDHCLHSLFGASKLAADVMVQEYGRYFGMLTCCLRGGCLTGPTHGGVELHGFLSYLVKCNLTKTPYTINGYKGKQVRDNIHSRDVASFIEQFIKAPRSGEVYNLGGGKDNTCSILEAIVLVESLTGVPMDYTLSDTARVGDHICYYSDLRKIRSHYPDWVLSTDLKSIFSEIATSWQARSA
jgi:CDP-paratose 2-epimerase